MATVTDSDLKEIKDLLTAGFSKSEANQARLETNLNDLKFEVGKLSEKVSGIIENRVNGLTKYVAGSPLPRTQV